MSDVINAEYFYIVVRDDKGQLVTFNKYPEEDIVATRTASTADMYEDAKQIVTEVDAASIASRVADLVLAKIAPETPTISDNLRAKLKERGIDPDSVQPA